MEAGPSQPVPLGSEVHDLDALDGVLVDPESLDALILAYLLDRGVAEPNSAASATPIPFPLGPQVRDQVVTIGPPAELVLYVVDDSESCTRAQRILERLLRDYDERALRLVIRNVTHEPLQPGEDRVIVAPTLVLRTPTRLVMAGEIDPDDLEVMLATAGVSRHG